MNFLVSWTTTPLRRHAHRARLSLASLVLLACACGDDTAAAPPAGTTATGNAPAQNGFTDTSGSTADLGGSTASTGAVGTTGGPGATPDTSPTTSGSTGSGISIGDASAPVSSMDGGGGTAPQADAGVEAGGGDAGPTPTQPVDPAWPMGTPEEHGIEPGVLEEAADYIQGVTGNRFGMVVVHDGALIFEKYWQGGPEDRHVIYSCTKSWGSTLIGIAVTQGLLEVQDPVTDWVPDPAPGVAPGATLEHVLTQSAHDAGRSFEYNSGYLLNTAPEVLMAATDMSAHAFFQEQLATPLGLSMVWPACPTGGCAGTRYPEGFIQFGNQPPEAPNEELPTSSVRDQAKLGWLWANDGVWRGQRLIDSAYVATASQAGAGPAGDYGYLWWVDGADQFSAVGGVGNCYVNVMPSKKLVIAVLGETALFGGGAWSDFRNVVSALD